MRCHDSINFANSYFYKQIKLQKIQHKGTHCKNISKIARLEGEPNIPFSSQTSDDEKLLNRNRNEIVKDKKN